MTLTNSVVQTSTGVVRDSFAWWSEIWIPVLIGAATVLVSIVALTASSRATRLAHAVEEQRALAAEERADDAARMRLQDMAIDEARVARRWVIEGYRDRVYFRRAGESPPGRTEAEQARIDAEVVLDQSLVPGAEVLLEITRFDVDQRWRYIQGVHDEGEAAYSVRMSISKRRKDRTIDRIRSWALSPGTESVRIAAEWDAAEADDVEYLMFGAPPMSQD